MNREDSRIPGAVTPAWLNTPTGQLLLSEETRQVQQALDSLFGDQFLQIGTWGDVSYRAFARTQRAHVAGESTSADLITRPEQLSIATDSIDVVVLSHVLESHPQPHAVLREVDRVLRSDGHIVVTGFNPVSLWGLRHMFSRRRFPPGANRMLTEHRVRDWLTLLDYAIEHAAVYNFLSPFFRKSAQAVGDEMPKQDHEKTSGLKSRLDHLVKRIRRRSPFAGCYVVVARKQMITLTPLRPVWRRRPRLVGGLVNPTTRNAA